MRSLSILLALALSASALHTTAQFFGVFRPDTNTNVEVVKIMPEDQLPDIPVRGLTEIQVKAYHGSTFDFTFKCAEDGKNLTFTKDKRWVACCPALQQLKGTEQTAFDCCDPEENVTGCNAKSGYKCCPDGQTFNGNDCISLEENPCAPCPLNQILINGHCVSPCRNDQVLNSRRQCVCAPGKEKDDERTCQPIKCPPGKMLINNHCQSPCLDQQYLLDGKCVCLPGTEKSADGTCKTRCPPGKNLLADGSCSPLNCREDQIEINGHCVFPCTPGKILVQGTCSYPPCPNNLERIDGECGCRFPDVEVPEYPCGGWGNPFCDSICYTPPCPRGKIRLDNGTCVDFCPDGQIVNGVCTPCSADEEWIGDSEKCVPICNDGELLDSNIDECVCKDGLTRLPPDYACKVPLEPQPQPQPQDAQEKCPSGIQTGKCYTFTFPNGQLLGFNRKSDSYIASNSQTLFGKFSLCTDAECAPGLPVKAGTSFGIHDLIQGDLGEGRKNWLSNDSDGAYITRTPRRNEAANFVIAKWPGGKHCLGGWENGIGLIKADEGGSVGVTSLTRDDQSCVLVTLTEVACDIRARTANCIGGNMTETSASSPAESKVVNASMPIDGSGVAGYF